MKRITLLPLLMLFFISSWSQTTLQLSFTANPSLNWMSSTNQNVTNQDVVLGYDFGLIGGVFFSENQNYSLLTGFQVVNTGGAVTYEPSQSFSFAGFDLPPNTEIRYRLRYLEVPFSIKLKTDQFHRVYYWGIFGLSGMVNIGAKGDASDRSFKKISINDEVNMFNLGMNVGVGFDFDLGGRNMVSAGIIFQNGLTDVTTDNYFTDKAIINSLKVRMGLIF